MESILDVPSVSAPALAARFPNRKGVNVVFVGSVGGAEAATLGNYDAQGNLISSINVVAVKREADDVLPHELGHVFQLRHSGLSPTNLMCGPTTTHLIDEVLTPLFCWTSFARNLTNDQIAAAQKNAALLR
jgi:hypothetical protein